MIHHHGFLIQMGQSPRGSEDGHGAPPCRRSLPVSWLGHLTAPEAAFLMCKIEYVGSGDRRASVQLLLSLVLQMLGLSLWWKRCTGIHDTQGEPVLMRACAGGCARA